MKKTSLGLFVVLLLAFASPVRAHTLWVNLYESFAHKPEHIITSLGWGHTVPMDDILDREVPIPLDAYELFGPDMERNALPLPVLEKEKKKIKNGSGLEILCGDLGARTFTLTDKTRPGTYQVTAVTRANYYSMYLDKEGKRKWASKPMDEIEGAQKVLSGMKYKAFAKAFFAIKNWTDPKPLGHDLEIMPETDLSNVHVGDLVPLGVLFTGKPLVGTPENMHYITATSNTFGGPDGFFLAARVWNGKAQFRMPTAGQWVVNIYVIQDVAKDPALKNLKGKCSSVWYAGTLSFQVKP